MSEITDAFVEFDIDNDGTITTKVIIVYLDWRGTLYNVQYTAGCLLEHEKKILEARLKFVEI